MVNGLLLASYDYGYDAAGNRTSVTETVNGTTVNIAWGYDDANRLLSEDRSSGGTTFRETDYTYDDAGNRTSETVGGQTTSYQYNNLDQITQVTKPNSQVHTYTYDTRGNLKQISKPGGNNENYEYDARSRLIQAVVPGNTILYGYDTDGHRISESVNGVVVTNFVWDEFSAYGDVVVETNASNVVTASYVIGNGSLISQTKNGTTSFFLPDAQGSTRTLTNTAGTASGTNTYTAHGETIEHTGTAESRYLYTGQQFDALTELYSLRARYYDPNVGRFLSRDTWAYDYQNPVEFNRYAYTANNPVALFDPSGLFGETIAKHQPGFRAGPAVFNMGRAVRAVIGSTAVRILVMHILRNVARQLVIDFLQDIAGWAGEELYYGNRSAGDVISDAEDAANDLLSASEWMDAAAAALSSVRVMSVAQAMEEAEQNNGKDIVYRNPNALQHPLALAIGFWPANPRAEYKLAHHVRYGSYPSVRTQFISFTRSLQIALNWRSDPTRPIYAVDLNVVRRSGTGVIFDLTIENVLLEQIPDSIPYAEMARRYARASQEVVVLGWVPPTAIEFLIP